MKDKNFKQKGFTLVELAVTIVVIIALMAVSAPIYNANTTKVKLTEGYALLATIRSAQERYYVEYGNFLLACNGSGGDPNSRTGQPYTSNEQVLGINARTNKYFTSFCIACWAGGGYAYQSNWYRFVAAITGLGGRMSIDYNLTSGVTFMEG